MKSIYSFHKKGYSTKLRATIKTLSAINTKNNFHQPSVSIGCNSGRLKSVSNISWGITMGKPKIAIKAELPPALPAMAESSVNKVLRLKPPTSTTKTNFPKCRAGLPTNNMNKAKATLLIISIRMAL